MLLAVTVIFCSHTTTIAVDVLQEIQTYLQSIKAVAIDFSQSDLNGLTFEGMLIIEKPSKFRCNYYEPFPLVIIGNGHYVSMYDYAMEHLSHIQIDDNIFNFLLASDINFSNKITVLFTKNCNDYYILRFKTHNSHTTYEIVFDNINKCIKKIIIYEENNRITLSFKKTEQIDNVSTSLFIIPDPKIFGKPDRLKKSELKTKFTTKKSR